MCVYFFIVIGFQSTKADTQKIKPLNIGITIYPASITVEEFRNALESNLTNYYQIKFKVVAFQNFDEIMQGIEAGSELFVKNFLKEHDLDYLVYTRNRRNLDLWLEVWNQEGMMENIGIPFSSQIENKLIDISVNAFVSIIENLDNQLYKNKLY
jgi:hypothetical protein